MQLLLKSVELPLPQFTSLACLLFSPHHTHIHAGNIPTFHTKLLPPHYCLYFTGRPGPTYASSAFSGRSTDETADIFLTGITGCSKKIISHKLASSLHTFTNKGHICAHLLHKQLSLTSRLQDAGRWSNPQSFPQALSGLARALSSAILGLRDNMGHEAQFLYIILSAVHQPFVRCLFPCAELWDFCSQTTHPIHSEPTDACDISPLLACSITGNCLLHSNLNH